MDGKRVMRAQQIPATYRMMLSIEVVVSQVVDYPESVVEDRNRYGVLLTTQRVENRHQSPFAWTLCLTWRNARRCEVQR